MRLHRLRMMAFQPFAETEEVNFDALADVGLFLVDGDTGAGKTSILDAVSYALFGKVPGMRDSAARLRSDHSTAQTRTEVILEATLGGRRVRVTRSPKQERPKARGTGTTEENARVWLEARADDGSWSVLADRADAVEHELAPLLGLTREQFCQVVLLPQGAFAKFLHASSDERAKILEQLFAAQRFSAAEIWLSEQRRAADSDVHRGLDAVADIASRAAQVEAEEPPQGWRDQPESLHEWLNGRIVLAEADEATAAGSRDNAEQVREEAEKANAAAASLAARQQRHGDALAAVNIHEAERQARDAAELELRAARRAAPVRPLIKRLTAARGAFETARASVETALNTLIASGDGTPVDTASLRSADARGHAGRLRQEAGTARAILPIEKRLADDEASLADVEGRIAATQAAAAFDAEWLDGASATRDHLAAAVESARAAVEQLPGLEAASQKARTSASAGTRRDHLVTQQLTAARQLTEAERAELDAKQEWLDAREARLAGIAAELAGELREGEPCRVCGSVDHPDPAHHGDGIVVDAAVEEALQDAFERARIAHAEAKTILSGLNEQFAAEAAVAGDTATILLATTATDAERAVVQARATASGLEAADTALHAHDSEAERRVRALAAAAESVAALAAEATSRTDGLDDARRQVGLARAGFATIAARLDVLQAQAMAWDSTAEALDGSLAAERELQRSLSSAESEAGAQDFSSLMDAAASCCAPEHLAELEAIIGRFDTRAAELRATAADPDLLVAAQQPAPRTDEAATTLMVASAALAAAQSAVGLAIQRAAGLRTLADDLHDRLGDLEPLLQRQQLVRSVAGLVDGSAPANRLKMPLAAYVLTARLEEIAEAASRQLEKMSDGRYALSHCDERAGRSKKAGLGLRVIDGWTGRDRPPGSLSGGETFQASLSLALGLADVVTAEAGGAQLQTLFVDEGFGSLGDRALEDMLDVLDGLRDRGRAVGVISHVAEMRQRIPNQLHVAKGRTGSRIVQT